MKRRIFWGIFITAFLVQVITVALILPAVADDFREDKQKQLKTEAAYIATAYLDGGMQYMHNIVVKHNIRVTLISPDGEVLYDNSADTDELMNHAGRAEFIAALSNGSGESIRKSDTLNVDTYYYALLLADGNVLRVSSAMESITGLLNELMTALLLISVFAILLAVLFAHFQTKRIMQPINELDLEHPFRSSSYDELTPLLHKVHNQQQHIAEQMLELQRNQVEFNDITDNMSEALVILGTDKKVLSANRSAKELFGSSVLKGKSYIELCRENHFLQAAAKAYEGTVTEGHLMKYGRSYVFSFTPVQSGSGMGCLFLARDITEKENAEKLRREFSANVSHELKTPLTSIMGFAELIKEGIAKPEDIPQFGSKIHKEAARLLSLIEDIIHLSMLDEGDIKAEFQPVPLQELAKNVLEELEGKAKLRNISLISEGEEQTVSGLEGSLHEMLFNLCDNAIAYNRPGGLVKVSTGSREGKAFLCVADTGIGIERQEQARVFERFYRVDKSRSRETGGTGLGLSIVKHIAMLHGADIQLKSEPNVGTAITIIFPIN